MAKLTLRGAAFAARSEPPASFLVLRCWKQKVLVQSQPVILVPAGPASLSLLQPGPAAAAAPPPLVLMALLLLVPPAASDRLGFG